MVAAFLEIQVITNDHQPIFSGAGDKSVITSSSGRRPDWMVHRNQLRDSIGYYERARSAKRVSTDIH